MADLYLTPAERYTAALGGFYYGDLPEPGTVYTQLIKDILDGATPEKEPKNILARFIYSLYISDLGDPYPRYELAKLLYWKLHDITPTKSGSILTVTIDGKEDYMTINTDLSRLWYKVLFGSKTDVITEFPYTFNTMQNKLSDWELFGNVEVSGTPTPDSPVMPNGTGERTGNLWDITPNANVGYNQDVDSDVSENPGSLRVSASDNGMILTADSSWAGTAWKIQARVGMTYYISFASTSSNLRATIYTADGNNKVTRKIANYSTNFPDNKELTILSNELYIVINISVNAIATVEVIKPTIAADIIPYEPYGYKIPISSANTTTPVYLGEVETTRKIRKYEFTGQENWNVNPSSNVFFANIDGALGAVGVVTAICSHYNAVENKTLYNQVPNNSMCIRANASILWIKDTDYDGGSYYKAIEDFKAYLAQQYAAGTPLTVWYVLANEETGVVNEPLMRIGDYADSLSRAQTGIDIPTVVGQNTLDVLTTVKPSSMSIEYTSAEENQSRSKRISLLKSPLKKGLIK